MSDLPHPLSAEYAFLRWRAATELAMSGDRIRAQTDGLKTFENRAALCFGVAVALAVLICRLSLPTVAGRLAALSSVFTVLLSVAALWPRRWYYGGGNIDAMTAGEYTNTIHYQNNVTGTNRLMYEKNAACLEKMRRKQCAVFLSILATLALYYWENACDQRP